MHAIVAKQCLWCNCAKKKTETELLLSQYLRSRYTKRISLSYWRIKTVQKNIWCSFKVVADAADKDKLYTICSTSRY